jgi:REP element-mobilizing transposase RayT
MARSLRVQYPGAVYHISSRGNSRQDIYLDEKDRLRFLKFLDSTIKRYGWSCHAYCLMTNHFHLLIETPEPNLAPGMKRLNSRYALSFNKRHQRIGHVLQGRYHSIVVEKHSYLLELCRYVVLNPVRAKLVENPEEWFWSSYRATVGIIRPESFLTVDWILGQFAKGKRNAARLYADFVRQGYDRSPPWEQLEGGIFLGEEGFAQTVREQFLVRSDSVAVPRVQRGAGRPSLEDLFPKSILKCKSRRNRKITEAFESHLYTQSEIGDKLRLHPASISRIIKDWKGKC